MNDKLYFLHGLKGSSKGVKAVFLKKHFPECIIPDFSENMHERLASLKQMVTEPAVLVGSSMGGLQALFFANMVPAMVKGMVLIAPAVGFFDESWCNAEELEKIKSLRIPNDIPCTLLAGIRDSIIPIAAIEDIIFRSSNSIPVKFLKLDDDHSMNNSLDIILDEIRALIVK